jgi:putative nucleotidyltransferase with HDIG domain
MAVAEASDFAFAVVTAQVRRRSMRELASRGAPVAITSFLVYAPVVVVLVLAYVKISPVTIVLFVVPTLAFQRLYTLYQRERRLGDDLRTANDMLARANLSFAVALVTALEASDAYTAGHSRAVAIYCRDIARRMGLPSEECDRAFLCGLVHDIGKVGLPPSLLGKEGPLTLEERRQMQEHSVIGERILREVDAYDDVATIVRHHHERIDGGGYPDGISSKDIPLLSRIIAVADAYNAMTSHRPYRDAMPSRVARLRLAQAVENQFDTTVVAAFEAILASVNDGYRSATSDEFRPGQPSVADDSDTMLSDAPLGVVGAA